VSAAVTNAHKRFISRPLADDSGEVIIDLEEPDVGYVFMDGSARSMGLTPRTALADLLAARRTCTCGKRHGAAPVDVTPRSEGWRGLPLSEFDLAPEEVLA
jgi:hypothetical protein